ncbi:N-acetylmuramoyl-L-alanine amidase, partial [Pseudomonas sp. FW305-47B]
MMISRLVAAVLAALLIAPAAAMDAELSKLARSTGTPDIPGLK